MIEKSVHVCACGAERVYEGNVQIDSCTGSVDARPRVDSVCLACDGKGFFVRVVNGLKWEPGDVFGPFPRSRRVRRQSDLLTEKVRVLAPCEKCDGRGTIPVVLAK